MFEISLGKPGTLGSNTRPNVLFIQPDGDFRSLYDLGMKIRMSCDEKGFNTDKFDDYEPHISIATNFRSNEDFVQIPHDIYPPKLSFTVNKFELLQATNSKDAKYLTLSEFELK